MPRRIDPAIGRAALERASVLWEAAEAPDRDATAIAVRYLLQELGDRAPGRSVEVRVPPFGAVQCIEGTSHRRGTPPAVVEMEAPTWIALCAGTVTWADAVAQGRVQASGERADLSHLLPLMNPE
jgi:hypothetical protein